MGNSIITCLFFSKNFKKIQHLAFTDKVKIINSYVPEKVKIFIEKNLLDELNIFKKNIHSKLKYFQIINLLFLNIKLTFK